MTPAQKPRTWLRGVVGGVVAVLVIVVVAPFVYIHFIEADPEPSAVPLPAQTCTTTGQAAAVDLTKLERQAPGPLVL